MTVIQPRTKPHHSRSHFGATSTLLMIATAALSFACNSTSTHPSPNPSPSPTATNNSGNFASPVGVNSTAEVYQGPYSTTQSEYHLPASVDSDVLPGVQTEQWAEVYRPVTTGKALPLLIFLHGNHATCGSGSNPINEQSCQYTFQGTCGANQFVIPNHLGYEYLATKLASWGYVVVSINANLGITCGNPVDGDSGLILARGRLILRHLATLSGWNQNGGAPSSLGVDLKGLLDFSQVGLFGHSRAGEGVRAAYNIYNDSGSVWKSKISSPVTFRAIFEVGPVDGMSSRTLNAAGVAWNALLPLCDGDVVNLDGMRPFDRMLDATSESPTYPKSLYAVAGANHNFYNTQWQVSDSSGCSGLSKLWNSGDSSSNNQQQTAVASVIPFFRAHVGTTSDPRIAAGLNPENPLAAVVSAITSVDRSYLVSPSSTLMTWFENFRASAGTGSLGQPEISQNVTVTHVNPPEHDPSLKAAEIQWSSAGSSVYYENDWYPSGSGVSITGNATLDFRVSRAQSASNSAATTDFQIQLVYSDNAVGPSVLLSRFFALKGPYGISGDLHATLPTIRVPLTSLYSSTHGAVRGVRFTFNGTATGDIYISSIGISRSFESTEGTSRQMLAREDGTGGYVAASLTRELASAPRLAPVNRVARVARVSGSQIDDPSSDRVEIELQSSESFPVRNALPVLMMNGREVAAGEFSSTGDLSSMTFKVKVSDLQNMSNQISVEVAHRGEAPVLRRNFGVLNKPDLIGN